MAVIESVRQRQKNATDFASFYGDLCALQSSCPVSSVTANLQEHFVDCNADRIRQNDWIPILNAVKINKSLKSIAFRSYWQQTLYPSGEASQQRLEALRKKAPCVRSKDMTHKLCRAIKECLCVTDCLNCIILQGLPLRERDLASLAKGLRKNRTLQNFSLEFCQIGDRGLDIVCNAIKNSTCIASVNFTGCSLTWRAADILAKVIKHQSTTRHSVAWQDSLRYRRPDLDRMPGLRRITLCKNPMLDDEGAVHLAEAMKDDLWVKALDLQQCGISSHGAAAFQSVLTYNTTLTVLDLRLNPLIDPDVMSSLMEQIMINSGGDQGNEYPWLFIEEPKPGRIRPLKKGPLSRNNRSRTVSTAYNRRSAKNGTPVGRSRSDPIKSRGETRVKKKPGIKGFVPWRTEERVGKNRHRVDTKNGVIQQYPSRKRGDPDSKEFASTSSALSLKHSARTLSTSESDYSAEDQQKIAELQTEVDLLRHRLQEESRERARADSRVLELEVENRRLHQEMRFLKVRQEAPDLPHPLFTDRAQARMDWQIPGKGDVPSILEDDRVLESIEASFKQFHAFLDLLKGNGFGDLVRILSQGGAVGNQERGLDPISTRSEPSSASVR